MNLTSKFILAITGVLLLSYGLLMFYTSILQNRLVIGQAEQQARMLHRQLLLTRQWVADHHGLFLVQSGAVRPNPYLDEPVLSTDSGMVFVKRNPAMVTRELSEYAAREGYCWFRVTSLKPVNPRNRPDDFERASLMQFEQGVPEIIQVSMGKTSRMLRYIAPLTVTESCLECHARHGYSEGDIRGGLSITVPIAWADKAIAAHNRSILLYGIMSICLVAMIMFGLFRRLVVQPLHGLARAMDDFPATGTHQLALPVSNDEMGALSNRLRDLCLRVEESGNALNTAREQGFRAEKLAALGQLTAGIAHEINNPLGGMLNCVKTMQQEPDNAAVRDRYLPLIEKGLRRIEHTMHQLLNYGRIEPFNLRPVQIDTVIRDCVELLDYRLRGIGVRLELGLPEPCCIDVEAIKQIVMNITLNAIQAMQSGGELDIATGKSADTLHLRFTDTGHGIDPGDIDRIFDPFFTTKEVGEGTGLGLAVTHSLVQRLGGDIRVESEPGAGTTFIVSLPVNLQCLQEAATAGEAQL